MKMSARARWVVALLGLAEAAGFWAMRTKPEFATLTAIGMVLLVALVFFLFPKSGVLTRFRLVSLWAFSLPAIVFVSSMISLSWFLSSGVVYQAHAVFTVVLCMILATQTYTYFRSPVTMSEKHFASMCIFINTVSVYAMGTALAGGALLTGLHLEWWSPLVMVVVFVLAWHSLLPLRTPKILLGMFSLVAALVVVELFWIFLFSPLSYFVTGFILAGAFHAMMTLAAMRVQSDGPLSFKNVRSYMIFICLLLAVVLASAPWQ